MTTIMIVNELRKNLMSRDSVKGRCQLDHVPRQHYRNEYGRALFPPIDCAEQNAPPIEMKK